MLFTRMGREGEEKSDYGLSMASFEKELKTHRGNVDEWIRA